MPIGNIQEDNFQIETEIKNADENIRSSHSSLTSSSDEETELSSDFDISALFTEQSPLIEKNISHSRLKKLGHLIKHTLATCEEILEGGSIAYSSYLILAYDPTLEGKYGYGFIVVGSVIGGITEILHINSVISNHNHHYYRLVKEALAGACVAAVYTEDFLPENLQTVAMGSAVALVLTTSKTLVEVFKEKLVFKHKKGKLLEYGIGAIYNSLMAAGIADYLFAICEGFGAQITPTIRYPIIAGLSLFNVLADLPINKPNTENDGHPLCYHPARAYRSFLYGSEIALFLNILIFDIITNILESDDIKDSVFYSVLALSLLQGIIVMTNKLINDSKDEHMIIDENSHQDEEQPLLQHEEEKESTCDLMREGMKQRWLSFWKQPASEQEEAQPEIIEEIYAETPEI